MERRSAQKVSVLKEIELISLTPAIRSERGLRRTVGAVVATISARVADELGIQTGDLIFQVNNAPVSDAPQVAKMLEYLSGRGPIRMWIERGGQAYWTDFQIGR